MTQSRSLPFAEADAQESVRNSSDNQPTAGGPANTLAAALRLCLVPGVGPRTRKALLERFGTAVAVFQAAPSDLRAVQGVGPKLVREISAARNQIDVSQMLAHCQTNQVSLLLDSEENYPRALKEIYDPPGVLFVRGEIRPADALAIAIVGTRHPTHYGLEQANRLAQGLARAGYTIISGLARGIDAAAHRGALAAGGRTLAVLGSGVLNIYPPEHVELAAEVAKNGAVISESPPDSPPLAGAFPQRNRIVTGMSLGVLVIEAATQSGALISARHAMEQGREVFAMPGRVDNRMARGCHQLIRDGATLLTSIDDLLSELNYLDGFRPQAIPDKPAQVAAGRPANLTDDEARVFECFRGGAILTPDALAQETSFPAAKLSATLMMLKLKRLIAKRSDGAFEARS